MTTRMESQSMICEHCNEHISRIEATHSLLILLQKVTPNGYTYGQCEQGQEYNQTNWQHFHCSEAHMIQNAQHCVNQHYSEDILHSGEAGTTRVHQLMLDGTHHCTLCQAPLTMVAYRFALTGATPYNHEPDKSMDQLQEWCCSLDHAKQQCCKNIAAIAGVLPSKL